MKDLCNSVQVYFVCKFFSAAFYHDCSGTKSHVTPQGRAVIKTTKNYYKRNGNLFSCPPAKRKKIGVVSSIF